ncbi:MAG: pyridoxal 5'-phosphate synthase glutaminase subunit PdxT [Dialister sp.]|nr:pyridoxal 5'-phosphate synthase glutaminase subunit PdxT [Dialister sp.]
MKPVIGILAVQGAFIEHRHMLESLGAVCVELRRKEDLATPLAGLVLPGGESTAQGLILRREDMLEPLKKKISAGLPVLATCAGMILLAKHISNDKAVYFATLPVTVHRNAYGRQLGSFITTAPVKGIGDVRMNFIRAPYIESVEEGVEILSVVDGHIVAVKYKNQMALSFHPEVGTDMRIHKSFLTMAAKYTANR